MSVEWDALFAKMQADLTAQLFTGYTQSAAPPPPSTPLADLLRVMDDLIPQARIEKWCVLDMVPSRWEPLTGWLRDTAWAPVLQALPPYGLYRVVDKRTRRGWELIPTPTGQFLQRTDGRSWLDPPEWTWTWQPQYDAVLPARDYGLLVARRAVWP